MIYDQWFQSENHEGVSYFGATDEEDGYDLDEHPDNYYEQDMMDDEIEFEEAMGSFQHMMAPYNIIQPVINQYGDRDSEVHEMDDELYVLYEL